MKLYELKIEDETTDEVFAISLVESPAIESDFIYFDKEEIHFAKVDNEKRMLIGPILIPEKRILRVDGEGNPYHVFFSKETVQKLAQNYLMKKYTDSATLEHDKKIKGVSLVESWVKDGKLDKSNNYGLAVPEGTWMGIFKITDENLWKDYVKTGKVKGFSIEGLFEHKLIAASEIYLEKDVEDLTEEEAEVFLSQLKALIRKDNRYKAKKRIDMESYSDYPQSVRDAARIARQQNEKVGNKCMTLVGKKRAADLEAGNPLSRETIARMVSYLSRAKDVYEQNKSDRESCSYIAYKGWGGETALTWAENKLKQIDMESQPSITSTYPGEAAKGKKKYKAPALFAIQKPNVNVFGYHTRYFGMCPGAQSLFEHLITMPVDEETIGMIRSAAQVADNVFRKEEEVIKAGVASQHDYEEVVLLVEDFKDIMEEIDEEVAMMHDVAFMDGHILKVKEYYNEL